MRTEDCVRLIKAGTVGRIAYACADGLVIIPVNYCYVDGHVVFRTAEDSAVAQFALAPIAFELDAFDERRRKGWSVLMNGMVRSATYEEIDAAHDRVEPWAGGIRDTYMTIEPHCLTGHRIRSS